MEIKDKVVYEVDIMLQESNRIVFNTYVHPNGIQRQVLQDQFLILVSVEFEYYFINVKDIVAIHVEVK